MEGGDCVWIDDRTLAVGRGVRTNQDGIQQLANLLGPKGISVYGFDLPLWHGEEACLHLMSVISPLADDLALVYAPLLPVAFWSPDVTTTLPSASSRRILRPVTTSPGAAGPSAPSFS